MSMLMGSESGQMIVQLSGVWKRYQDGEALFVALDNVSIGVDSGDFVGVLGPSGCGKTTLLGVMGGLVMPSEGDVLYDGVSAAAMSESALSRYRAGRVGFVFQDNRLAEHLTVRQNVAIPLLFVGCEKAKALEEADTALEKADIASRAGSYPRNLSFGQRKRVCIARALASNPPLILADEPTAGLDSASGDAVMDLLSGLNEAGSTAIVIATHNEAHAHRARKLFKLVDGRLTNE
jgi:putative ABC transport system ATP-binding protein